MPQVVAWPRGAECTILLGTSRHNLRSEDRRPQQRKEGISRVRNETDVAPLPKVQLE